MRGRADREEPEYGPVILLVGILAVAVMIALVFVGGAAAGLVFGGGWAWPAGHTLATLAGLVAHAGHPAAGYPPGMRAAVPGPVAFWSVVIVLEGAALMGGTVAAVAVAATRAQAGMVTRAWMRTAMREIRSSPCAPYATYLGIKVRPRPEDAALVIAPQQSGKTTRVAVGRIKDAPGAVLAASTKSDLLDLTLFCRTDQDLAQFKTGRPPDPGTPARGPANDRAARGGRPVTQPVPTGGGSGDGRRAFVFDPDRITGFPHLVTWDIVAGCQDAKEASRRAAAMVAARPLGKGPAGGNMEFFEGQAKIVLRCLLHAAAIGGKTMAEVVEWVRDFSNEKPLEILDGNPAALPGWASDLRKATRGEAQETIQSTAMTLAGATEALTDPAVLAMVCPTPGRPGFDVEQFVARGRDTVYVLSEGGQSVSTAPLVTAFVSSVVSAARRASQASATRKLDPMLTFVLDEVANVAPIPELDMLLSDGGGRGMSTWALVQSFGQLRARWGRDGFDSMWGATSLKLLLPGCTEGEDLERISRGIGERRFKETVVNSTGLFGPAGGSTSRQWRTERAMPPDAITQMEDGTALLIYKNVGNAVVQVPGWWQRPDSGQFASCQEKVARLTGRALPYRTSRSARAGRAVGAIASRARRRAGAGAQGTLRP